MPLIDSRLTLRLTPDEFAAVVRSIETRRQALASGEMMPASNSEEDDLETLERRLLSLRLAVGS